MSNDCTEEFKDEAIRLAEAAGYKPGASQRNVDWSNVKALTDSAKQHGNWGFLHGNELIIMGSDGISEVIDNGMHRVLASGMSGIPLPESMFYRGGYFAPSVPWSSVR